ncbi:MAG: DNA cytosine methyltransferase [Gammaproteobacteria bacterium]|nr:DNA cytosine methyltransferase [Gammaproteobacteria bacterium]MCP5136356.1 DNA cytosine methyltransferase [Gammaproteobacteria bacterium]
MAPRATVVDLFCGCGGFGLGAEQAGFHSLAAIDIDDALRSAYQYNFPSTKVLKGDLSEMGESAWHMILRGANVDGVIGGPPCQGFSRMGYGDTCDPRRSLLAHFFRTVNIIKPKFFVMENVEGLLDDGNIEGLEQAIATVDDCYTVLEPVVVNASDFGAPTKRARVIVVGYDAARMSSVCVEDLLPRTGPITTVEDAISDIPSPLAANGMKEEFGWKPYRDTGELSSYAMSMRAMPPSHLGNPEAREQLATGRTSGHFNTIHKPEVRARFTKVLPGQVDRVSRAKRLSWQGQCPTLRAGTGSDRGSHQAVRPIHPDEPRVITVREAARLQGFPDWFCFHPAKWHSFRMIGNSVSPLVSEHLLRVIHTKLEQNTPGQEVCGT